MIDTLRARFLPRFLAIARGRVERGIAHVSAGRARAEDLAADLHTLAGDAGLLEITDVAEAARAGEDAARRWARAEDDAERIACGRSLELIARALDELTARAGGAGAAGAT